MSEPAASLVLSKGNENAQSGATKRGSVELPKEVSSGDAKGSVTDAPTPPPVAIARPNLPAASADGVASPEWMHYLEGLVDAAHDISGALEPTRVAEAIVTRAGDLLKVPGVSVMLMDDRGSMKVGAARGLSLSYLQSQGGTIEQTIAGRALAEGRTFATWDARQSPDPRLADAATREGIVSVACAPMFFGARPVGALNVYCRDARRFTPEQFHVLSLLAAQGAVALSNARAFKELRAQSAQVQTGFRRVGEALSASRDIGETLRLIVQLAGEMTGADAGAMFMLQTEGGGGMRLAGVRGMERRSVGRFRLTSISPLARRALQERRSQVVPDTRRVTDTAFPTLRLSVSQTAEARSAICVPVMVGEQPLGVLEQYSATEDKFTRADVQLLNSFALQAAVAIENSRLYAQERSVAQTLQRAFLPDLPQTISGFQIGRIYAPGSEVAAVGGDTYDLFTLPDGRIAAFMADVSGQGVYAATLAVMAKYTIRAYALENPDPSHVLARANDAFVPQTSDAIFITMCYALIDPQTRTVSLASAAHPPVLLCRAASGKVTAFGGEPGLIAGFLNGQEYPAETTTLLPGDILVFYTDGITEARRRKIMFSSDGKLEKVIAQNAHLSAQEIAAAVYTAVLEWVGGERTDDIALLVLKAE